MGMMCGGCGALKIEVTFSPALSSFGWFGDF